VTEGSCPLWLTVKGPTPQAGTPRPPIVAEGTATTRTPSPESEDSELSTQRVPVATPRPPIVPVTESPAPRAQARSDADAADEATTVMPPLFPMQDPVIPAAQPEAVYAGRPAPPDPRLKWIAAGGGVVLLLLIGLIARACSSDRPAGGTTPDSGVHERR